MWSYVYTYIYTYIYTYVHVYNIYIYYIYICTYCHCFSLCKRHGQSASQVIIQVVLEPFFPFKRHDFGAEQQTPSIYVAMNQYLLIPFLEGWTSIYQLFLCSPGVQGFDPLPCYMTSLGYPKHCCISSPPQLTGALHTFPHVWMVKGHVWEGQIAGNPPQNVMLPEKIICEAYASFPQITTSSVVCGDLWSFLVMPGPGEYHLPMVPQWEDQAPLAHLMWGLPGGVVKTCWTKTTYSWDIRVSSVKWLWHLSHFQGGWTSINLEPLPKWWHDDEARSGWVQLLPNKKLSTTWCIGSLPEGGALNCWLSWCTWL